jgi:hypothetical protein
VEESNNRRVGEREVLEVDSWGILEALQRLISTVSSKQFARIHNSLSILLRLRAIVWLLPTVLRRWLAVSALVLLTGIVAHVAR